jgi:hypothetical protein
VRAADVYSRLSASPGTAYSLPSITRACGGDAVSATDGSGCTPELSASSAGSLAVASTRAPSLRASTRIGRTWSIRAPTMPGPRQHRRHRAAGDGPIVELHVVISWNRSASRSVQTRVRALAETKHVRLRTLRVEGHGHPGLDAQALRLLGREWMPGVRSELDRTAGRPHGTKHSGRVRVHRQLVARAEWKANSGRVRCIFTVCDMVSGSHG